MTPPLQVDGLQFMTSEEVPDDYGRWMIHGPQGSGKTTLASTIAEAGKCLFIDFTGEKGIRSFKGAPYAKNIVIARPSSITQLDDLFWQLNKGDHDFKSVVLDSLTGIQKMAMRFILGHDETAVREIKKGSAPADQRAWGQTLDIMVDTATFWYGLADGNRAKPMHVVMTAQTKIKEGDALTDGAVSLTPDVQKGALGIALATPDYILYTDVEENIEALSDESLSPVRHIVRFGSHPGYRTKARIPHHLRGKIPPILGRKSSTSLTNLSRVLGIGGIPAAPKKTTAAKPAAEASTTSTK